MCWTNHASEVMLGTFGSELLSLCSMKYSAYVSVSAQEELSLVSVTVQKSSSICKRRLKMNRLFANMLVEIV